MFSKRVVVVGCGALGCRHIEGLFRSHEPIEIIGIDLTEEVLENCRNFCHQLQNDGSKMTRFFTLSDSLKETLDAVELCIVATTANGRSELLTNLNTVMSPTYWVLEKPIAQSVAQIRQIERTLDGARVFVNFARRQMAFHRKIHQHLSGCGPYNVTLRKADFDIACNISHIIDLVSWWGGGLPIDVDITGLGLEWRPAKRKGFFEIDGSICINFDEGSRLVVESGPNVNGEMFVVSTADGIRYNLDEQAGLFASSGDAVLIGKNDYQSNLSGTLFDQLLSNGNCSLPSLAHSVACNTMVMRMLLKHWNQYTSYPHLEHLPVT